MATLTQVPTSVGSPAQWSAAGTSDPGCVSSDDGDTTFLETTSQSYAHVHYCTPAIPGEAISPVNSCVGYAKARTPATDTGGLYFGSESTWISGPDGITGTYALYGGTWPSLAKSGIDGVGTKIQTNSGGTINQRVTYIYRSIDYTVAAGGFAFLLGVAGLVSGPIGTITDWMHFRNLLRWQSARKLRNTILTGDEVRLAWREIRECRHPRFFFPRTA